MPSPDKILEELDKYCGIVFSRRGLLRYEEWDVITKPVRGSEGRGIGRFTEYPEEVIYEAYVGYCLINGTYAEKSEYSDLKFPKISPQLVAFLRNNFISNDRDKDKTIRACKGEDSFFKVNVLPAFQELYIELYIDIRFRILWNKKANEPK